MERFEKITKIDGNEVKLVTSYNNMEVYQDTVDSNMLWLVVDGQVIFSFYGEFDNIHVAEEFMNL